VAIAAWLLLSFAAAAQDGIHAYDIPAQPLEQAVERFSVISGWSVMYPGDLAAGRSSHALQASLPPLPALQMLLQDTGIEAELTINVPGVPREQVEELVQKAHIVCPYSNATRGNIDVTLVVA